VVDVGGDDGAPAGDFAAHEFGCDERRDLCAETFARRDARLRAVEHFFAAQIFADRDEFHFLGDDAGFGEFILRNGSGSGPAQGLVAHGEFARQVFARRAAIVFGLDLAAVILLDVTTLLDPLRARARQSFLNVDRDVRIGVGP